MFEIFRSKLPLKFKFQLRSSLAFLSFSHLVTIINPNSRQVLSTLDSFFSRLAPHASDFELIRIGNTEDGGYLIPDTFLKWDTVVSPGVGDTTSFERAISYEKTKVILIDGTIDMPSDLPPNFQFKHAMLRGKSGINSISLTDVSNSYVSETENNLLQIDIEGGEWDVLFNTSAEILQRYKVIVIELHKLDAFTQEKNTDFYSRALSNLLESHFACHFHVNNAGGYFFFKGRRFPKVVEVTLIHNSLSTRGTKIHIPVKLDAPCSSAIYDWEFGRINRI